MNSKLMVFGLSLVTLAAGCSSPQKRFAEVIPGMTGDEVKSTMHAGPQRIELAGAAAQYSTWYFEDGSCLLFKDNRVVAKDAPRSGNSAEVVGVKYEEMSSAQCTPPGSAASTVGPERTVEIPGFGKAKMPGRTSSKLAPGARDSMSDAPVKPQDDLAEPPSS